jgi:hypothetical protein
MVCPTIGDGFAAGRDNLRHHLFGGLRIAAATVQRAAQVVDHHLGAQLGQQQRMRPAQSATGTCHNCDFVLEGNGHGELLKKLS